MNYDLQDELKKFTAKTTGSGCVWHHNDDVVTLDGQFSIDELREIANIVQKYLNSQQPEEIKEKVKEGRRVLEKCEMCNKLSWDGRICHNCGMELL